LPGLGKFQIGPNGKIRFQREDATSDE
jgi:hypothetical protein